MPLTLVHDSTERDAVRQEYWTGTEDGFVDGAYDVQWAAAYTSEKIVAVKAEAAVARQCSGRLTRAYALGYARGYRQAVQEGAKP